jgi:cytochrome P450
MAKPRPVIPDRSKERHVTTSTTVDIADPQFVADPLHSWDRVREEAPLRRVTGLFKDEVWLVTRQEDVRAVLADPRVITDPTKIAGAVEDVRTRAMLAIGVPEHLLHYLTTSIVDVDGAAHTRLRKLVSRAFTVRRVGELRPRVEQITGELLDRLAPETDLLEQFAYPLPITVICELVGVPEADRPNWRRWGAALVTMDPARIPTAMTEMIAHCHDLTDRKRAEPQDDLLTALTAAVDEDGDRLSDPEIVTMLLSLVFAGHETTAHLIANSAYALMTDARDQLAVLRRDPAGWPAAINELVRTNGMVHIARVRYATEDMEIGGVTVRRGEAIMPVLVTANRDPRVYAEPEHVDVTRRPAGRGDGHVGFGHGPHYCLGAALARQEGEVALRMLFERYPDVRFTGGEPKWLPMPGARRLTELPVQLG